MRKSKLFTVFFVGLLFVFVGVKTPVISAVSDFVVDLKSDHPYASDRGIDISVNNPNYPGYGEGISAGTIYSFDGVITIRNNVSKTGWDTICVSLVSKSDKLRFYLNKSEISGTVNVTLRGNESTSVGIVINASSSDLGIKEIPYSVFVYEGECK